MGRSCASSSLDTSYTEPSKIRIGRMKNFFRLAGYLIVRDEVSEPMRTSDLRFGVHHQCGVTVARPAGVLDTSTYPMLRDMLLRYAAEQPEGLVVDVEHLHVPSVHALTVFSLVAMRVADWPGVPVMLVARDEDQRSALMTSNVSRFVPVHASVATALDAIGDPPARSRAVIELSPSPLSIRRARYFVRTNCERWQLAGVAGDAMTVVTAFVENTLTHTDSMAFLRIELRRGALTIAVSDDDPTPAVLHERLEGGVPPSGLLLVSGVAKTWGCTPTLTGGKTVWAVLRPPQRAAGYGT